RPGRRSARPTDRPSRARGRHTLRSRGLGRRSRRRSCQRAAVARVAVALARCDAAILHGLADLAPAAGGDDLLAARAALLGLADLGLVLGRDRLRAVSTDVDAAATRLET